MSLVAVRLATLETRKSSGGNSNTRQILRGPRLVWRRGQSGEPDTTTAFVPDVESDQQSGNLLDDARVFQFAAVNRADARDPGREFHRGNGGLRIVAAHDHV